MGKRINLSQKINNSDNRPNKHSHPFYLNDEEIEDNNSTNNNDESADENDLEEEAINANIEESNQINNLENRISTRFSNSASEETTKKALVEVALKNPIVKKVLLILIPVIIFLLLVIFMIAALSGDDLNGRLATSGYYAIKCQEVTVNIADKNQGYEIVDTVTVPFEDYIAGVVAAEVGMFNNLEVYKEFALAARTYFLSHEENCTIEGSDKRQVYKDPDSYVYASLIHQAVDETKGKVLLTNGELRSVQYDAFCSIDVDDENYTLKQSNQKIPRIWADSQSGIAESWKQGNCTGNHGEGLSQWGSYYLATKEGYTYEQILHFYLGDNITISSSGFSSLIGLEIKDTRDANTLNEPLSVVLPQYGGSVEELNNFISNSVNSNGFHTRAGVVAAAVSLINYLYDGAKVKIPYYWGGQYQHIGVDSGFGGRTKPSTSIYGNSNYYSGFDCSGFVSWAIKNGGFDISRHTSSSFHSHYSGDSCVITDRSCIGQPGDLINSNGCHVQLIVSADENSGTYYVAESTGGGVIMNPHDMHSSNCGGKETRILHMNSLYGD